MRGFYPLDNAESTKVSGARDFDIANGWSKSLQIAGYIHCTDLSGRMPYSEMVFFARNGTVNLTWRGDPNDPAQDGDIRRFDGSCDSIVWRSKFLVAGCAPRDPDTSHPTQTGFCFPKER